jgi:hypothetical protein
MKIKIQDISKFTEILKKFKMPSDYNQQKAQLFFPIDSETTTEDRDTGVILLETKKDGFAKLVQPGLVFGVEHKKNTDVHTAYATLEYKIPFSISEYVNVVVQDEFITNEELKFINEHECYLVPAQQILINFNFKK